ncbi:RICIN domain-containing protein [Stigmatella hybrida]|uniref:RICIN domain-containing protein n=1 Tax=Stigmatella hybrida TaxID=394097 RepID=UPI001CDA8ACE
MDANGTRIHLWACMAGNANQQWVLQGKRWVWAQHNKCLHVDGSKGVAGTVVHLWTYDLQRGEPAPVGWLSLAGCTSATVSRHRGNPHHQITRRCCG